MAKSQRKPKVKKPIPIRKKIMFLEECEPKDGSGVVYEKGDVKTLPAPSANHWIKRGKAIEYDGRKKPEPKKVEKPEPPKDRVLKAMYRLTSSTESSNDLSASRVDTQSS